MTSPSGNSPTKAPTSTLREIVTTDRDRWAQLYEWYCQFYKTPFTAEIGDEVWGWIETAGNGFEGRMIVDVNGETIGLCHFREYPLPLLGKMGGFIDDIFVDPQARGSGAAAASIEYVKAFGSAHGWATINWLTGDDNYRARGVYDRYATRTLWVTYEIEL